MRGLGKENMDLTQNLSDYADSLKFNRMYRYQPYGWQEEFHNQGLEKIERMLCAANRTGKTFSAAEESAFHATGIYPDWWEGKRFRKPTLGWIGGITNESLRDIVQKEVLGGLGDKFGTGTIPLPFLGKPRMRQAGISGVVDSLTIKHISGSDSEIIFKSYEQGWRKWQGTEPDYIWLDEEPDDFKIYTECRTRIITSNGIIYVTFTPLTGLTDLVLHFREGKEGTYVMNVTWDDAPHLSEKQKRMALASYPEHEKDARSKGIPMMGEGRLFPFAEEDYRCKAFAIPDHYREIIGIDFGWDHPAATSKISYDADNDVIYVSKSHKREKMDAAHHAEVIIGMGGNLDGVPVTWPHDGLNTEKGKGTQLIKNYNNKGINLLSKSARFNNDVGGGQSIEKSVMEIYERIESDRFKIFNTETKLLEEIRNLHRKDGKVVDRLDDCFKSVCYAMMMLRYAVPKYIGSQQYPGKIL